jgi:hypothetical protein
MGQMSASEWQRLSEAIVTWTGRGAFSFPRRDDALLVRRFGSGEAMSLIPKVHAMANEFYSSKANEVADNLAEMALMAAEEFKKRYPDISDDAASALAWCYTFDYK